MESNPSAATESTTKAEKPDFSDGLKAAKIFGALLLLCVSAIGASVLLASIMIPRTINQQRGRAEIDAIESLQRIALAQAEVHKTDADENGKQDFVDLKTLKALKRVGTLLGSGARNGYVYEAETGRADIAKLWWATARPNPEMGPEASYFFINQNGQIYSATRDFQVDRLNATVPAGMTKVEKKIAKRPVTVKKKPEPKTDTETVAPEKGKTK